MIPRRTFLSSIAWAGAARSLPEPKALPGNALPPLGDLTRSSATRLARAVRSREVSALELADAFLARIQEINPRLNAVVQVDPDRVRKAARLADEQLARGHRLGALHGVPITIKDSFDTAGIVSSAGTTGRRAYVPPVDATAVARLRGAGAIVLGKTNCPELTLSYETDNLIYGRTNNPYDLTRTPGGSSGGAAAALAASCSPLDLGSDTGGSIRVPSHFCGTAGIKPTSGRVSRTGHIIPPDGVFQFLTQVGPMARYVDDLVLTLPLLAGTDWHDASVVPIPLSRLADRKPARFRIAFHTNNGVHPVTADTAAVITRSAAALAAAGHSVTETVPPELASTYQLGNRLWRIAGSSTVRRLLDRAGTTEVSPPLRPWLRPTNSGSDGDWTGLLEDLDRARGRMLSFLEQYDAIVCPACAFAAPLHGAILEQDLDAAFSYSEVFNYVGWPAAVVRTGTSEDSLPIATQIVARPWREDVALALAKQLEDSFGGWRAPPA